jgi:hypothetical protein
MAREESSREDLLREATALVERIELAPLANGPLSAGDLAEEHIVVGFRRDGALSIFFGEDPVYQFNPAGELRRAYCDGKLLKAVGGQLAALDRVRTEHETQLVRHDLTRDEQATFIAQMQDNLKRFAQVIKANGFEIVGQVPTGADVLIRVQNWFASHNKWPIAARPNA